MQLHSRRLALAVATSALVALASGCASTQSTRAKSLKTDLAAANSLADCQNITVLPFDVPANGKVDRSRAVNFARDVENRLSNDFGSLFDSVEYAEAARGVEKECVVKGRVDKYRAGSRIARAILIGMGSASFEGAVEVQDAASGKSLLNAPFDKLWAWGGIVGASKGIDEMVNEAAASVAATLARAKGWSGGQ